MLLISALEIIASLLLQIFILLYKVKEEYYRKNMCIEYGSSMNLVFASSDRVWQMFF